MALVVSEIKLYELLKSKIGEREAEAFIEILETKVESKLNEKTSVFATKEDLAKMELGLIKWIIATVFVLYGLLMASMKFFFHL